MTESLQVILIQSSKQLWDRFLKYPPLTDGKTDLEVHPFVQGDSGARLEPELVLVQIEALQSSCYTADPPPAASLQAYNKCYQN